MFQFLTFPLFPLEVHIWVYPRASECVSLLDYSPWIVVIWHFAAQNLNWKFCSYHIKCCVQTKIQWKVHSVLSFSCQTSPRNIPPMCMWIQICSCETKKPSLGNSCVSTSKKPLKINNLINSYIVQASVKDDTCTLCIVGSQMFLGRFDIKYGILTLWGNVFSN